jgi:hypothetical protein
MDDETINKIINSHEIDKEIFNQIIEVCDQYFSDDETHTKKRKAGIANLIEDLAKSITADKKDA